MPRFRPDFVNAWKEIETGGARAAVIIATEYVEDALEGSASAGSAAVAPGAASGAKV